MSLDQKGTAMAEYIWIDSTGGVRSKSKVRCIPYIHPTNVGGFPVIAITTPEPDLHIRVADCAHSRTRSRANTRITP